MILTTLDPRIRVDPSLHLRSPGVVLLQDYVQPSGLSMAQLARRSGIPAMHIKGIMQDARPVTAKCALRFAGAFDTSGLYWMLLQAHHDLQPALRHQR